jgi:hypothetical protein
MFGLNGECLGAGREAAGRSIALDWFRAEIDLRART